MKKHYSHSTTADQEAKRGTTLTQSTVTMDCTTVWATLTSHQNDIADGRSTATLAHEFTESSPTAGWLSKVNVPLDTV